MNKILIYTVIAILLGTITMVTPLAVPKPSEHTLAGKDSVTNAKPDAEAVEREEMFANPEEPSASLEDQEVLDSLPEEPAAYETVGNVEDVAYSLSSIGLMIVPSFLTGLGVFVCLKKRMF
jgi:tetrahydromethanopterin S-methyltransferase subunit B